MIGARTSTKWQVALGVASIAGLLVVYSFLACHQHRINPADTTLPNWWQLQRGATQIVSRNGVYGERWLIADAQATLLRLLLGLICGTSGALMVGLAMGCLPKIEALCAPALSFLAKIPPTAALAVFFVMAGTQTSMYVAMIAFGVLPALAQSVYLAVQEVPEELLHKAYTLGASNIQVLVYVICRYCLPRIIDSIRLQIGPAVVYLIAAEMVCGDVGFGYRIRLQSRLLNMNVVYPYIVLLGGFGFVADYALRRLRFVCCPWYAR